MNDLLTYIVKNLVSKPDSVAIEETLDNGLLTLTLTVNPSDMGLIIGKQGQTIRSIRKILTVRAIAEHVKVNLQLSEPTPAVTEPTQSSEQIATSVDDSTSSQ